MEPDYFANRKMVEFFHGELVPIAMRYEDKKVGSGIDLEALEQAFQNGVRLFLFSNPNNPVGCVYSYDEICGIAALAKRYDATLIVDELYSRQVYSGVAYTHLRAQRDIPENLITIIGPSKTESLSGYRLAPRSAPQLSSSAWKSCRQSCPCAAAAITRPYFPSGSTNPKDG